ncbi:MAG: OmpA family protein [Chitinophagaceae bacterium]
MKKYFLISALLATSLVYSQSNESVFVHFAFDKYELNKITRSTLDSLTDILEASDRIELHGHCDANGSDDYNIRLSQQRVKAVENYLMGLGWEKKDINVVQAHGERKPLNDNVSETDRSLNRRVEIRVFRGHATTSLKQKLADSTLKTGDNIVLRNINFEGGMHLFLPSAQPMLDELLDAMRTYPKLVIGIEGHICCHEDSGEGIDNGTGMNNLSSARAKAVLDYLVTNGIDAKRLSSKGFGHSAPIYPFPEKTDEERTANRRVEIKIISK